MCVRSCSALLAGFIRFTVRLDVKAQTSTTVASIRLSILRSVPGHRLQTVTTALIAKAELTPAPAASHRVIPTLTGLDFLDVRTTFRFCHCMMNRIHLSDSFRLYVGKILPTFLGLDLSDPFPVQGERQATPRGVKWTPAAERITN